MDAINHGQPYSMPQLGCGKGPHCTNVPSEGPATFVLPGGGKAKRALSPYAGLKKKERKKIEGKKKTTHYITLKADCQRVTALLVHILI